MHLKFRSSTGSSSKNTKTIFFCGLFHIKDGGIAEPGYYEDGNFGVRIENVLIVKEAQAKHNFGGKGYLAFEHITWVRDLQNYTMISGFYWFSFDDCSC